MHLKQNKVKNYTFSILVKLSLLVFIVAVSVIVSLTLINIRNQLVRQTSDLKDKSLLYAKYTTSQVLRSYTSFRNFKTKQEEIKAIQDGNADVLDICVVLAGGKIVFSLSGNNQYSLDSEQLQFSINEPLIFPLVSAYGVENGERVLKVFSNRININYEENIREYQASVLYVISLDSIRKTRIRIIVWNSVIALILLLASFVLTLFLARQLSNPIKALTDSAKKVASGDLEHTITVRTGDEIEELATHLNHMRLSLRKSIIDLKAADTLKDDFLANTSHELKTPLNGIIGIADSLIDGATGDLAPITNFNLKMIVQSGRRLQGLINDILDFTRLKNHNIHLKTRPVELHSLVTLAFAICSPLVGQKKLELINSIPNNLVLVQADENRLEQILLNLIGNAIKFTEKGSIEARARVVNEMVEVLIKDTGIGISRAKQEQIFKSFGQADSSISREYGGTGLGLSISRQLVELHGGTIWVESTESEGASFYFSLPVSREHEQVRRFRGELEKQRSNILYSLDADISDYTGETVQNVDKKTILIVDDEPVNIQVLKNHLRMYNIITAQDGYEALDLFINKKPDLVVLDLMMPRISGYEVCEKMRRNAAMNELPIIILTAKNQVSDLVKAFSFGANDYLVKPFLKEELLTRIKNQLELKDKTEKLKDLNLTLESKVVQRTLELQSKNSQIMESLKYASRIQGSILPDKSEMERYLEDFFVLWNPRDIVGGDFYWVYSLENAFLAAVIDCTGHGVPGALMTMTTNSLLNRIVNDFIFENPARILEILNSLLRATLRQDSGDPGSNDGMDMSILYCKPDENKLIWAGAKQTLFYCAGQKVHSVNGDRQSIGYVESSEDFTYTNHELSLDRIDAFYMTTDGYLDQLGGGPGFPYGKKRFKALLLDHYTKPFSLQKELFLQDLDMYRKVGTEKEIEQIDDITLLGFKIKCK